MSMTKLQKIGSPILTMSNLAGSARASYYVGYDGEHICGIAIFHEDDEHCTVAMLRDEHGERVTMCHFTATRVVEKEDLVAMIRIYDLTLGCGAR